MELEDLKSQFKSLDSAQISKESLVGMLRVNQHPVLRRIRIQMIIESIAWMLFLAFYYNFFDGHLKSIFWNIALVISIGLMLVHNLLGFQVINNPIKGGNLVESLVLYVKKLKKYAYLAIGSRVLALAILFGFFFSGLEAFEQRHYISIGACIIIVVIQALVLGKIWRRRIQAISAKYRQFIEED